MRDLEVGDVVLEPLPQAAVALRVRCFYRLADLASEFVKPLQAGLVLGLCSMDLAVEVFERIVDVPVTRVFCHALMVKDLQGPPAPGRAAALLGRVRTVDTERCGLKITEVIEVQRSPEQVWSLFNDIPALASCLPGAELTEDKGEGVYAGTVTAKLGPMTAKFEGEATVEADAAAHTGSVNGKGVDKSGGSVGQVKVAYTVEGEGEGTKVTVDADVILSGPAAQFGRTGLIKEMSRRLIGEFVECVEAKLSAETEEEAATIQAGEVKGLSLFFSSLLTAISNFLKRLFGGKGDGDEEG